MKGLKLVASLLFAVIFAAGLASCSEKENVIIVNTNDPAIIGTWTHTCDGSDCGIGSKHSVTYTFDDKAVVTFSESIEGSETPAVQRNGKYGTADGLLTIVWDNTSRGYKYSYYLQGTTTLWINGVSYTRR